MIDKKDIVIRDPYIYFENDIFYLYSAFHFQGEKYPCFICYESKDLEKFSLPVKIFEKSEDFWGDMDFWAPEMHKYNGKYYLFATFKSKNKCRGCHILVSSSPKGPFSPLTKDPITPFEWECLDATLFVLNEQPYLIFSREWLQVKNGEIYIAKLSKDLKTLLEQPKLLFKAADSNLVVDIKNNDYVTDGPFVFEYENKLLMIWSSFIDSGYALLLASADNIYGPWTLFNKPLYKNNGGHGMIFEKDNKQYVCFHSPNSPNGNERLQIELFSMLLKNIY